METAFILRVPEAESLVRDWRMKHDTSAPRGMPAHVTVLYPFMPLRAISADVYEQLDALFAAHTNFELTFSSPRRFPDTVWLSPEPAAPVKLLTGAMAAAFADYPPYRGTFPDTIPHLTVAQGDSAVLDAVAADLMARLTRPIHAHITACVLFAMTDAGWREQRSFPLGTSK